MKKNRKGATMIEMMTTAAIVGIIILVFAQVMRYLSKTSVETQAFHESVLSGIQFFAYFEHDLHLANEITRADSDCIRFILDSNQLPDYDRNGNYDAADEIALGIGPVLNYIDPDIDGDLDQVDTAGALGTLDRVGFNLPDDDDFVPDGQTVPNGEIDLEVEYCLEGTNFVRDRNIDGAGWNIDERVIAEGIESLNFEYFGSRADNVAAALLDGNNDGIITEAEIDGNSNGLQEWDERQFVTTVRMTVKFKKNPNADSDLDVTAEITPPLLPLKALQRGLGG